MKTDWISGQDQFGRPRLSILVDKEKIKQIQSDARAELLERIADLMHQLQPKMPKPTLKQAECLHKAWHQSKPQPRSCPHCDLLMWSAGD